MSPGHNNRKDSEGLTRLGRLELWALESFSYLNCVAVSWCFKFKPGLHTGSISALAVSDRETQQGKSDLHSR